LTKVSVAFICDSYYVIPTAVAITSLIQNKNQNTYYDIYIIAADLSENEFEKFYEFRGSNTDIHIIKASLEKFNCFKKNEYITLAAFLKFDLPDLIPKPNKVLYLDSDVLIQKDLSNLFEINIKDCYAGVIKNIFMTANDFNIKNYFNSGVMLLNLDMMRENNASTALFNIRRSINQWTFMDQDCFNIYFDEKVKLLPLIYNFFYSLFLHEKLTLEDINKIYGTHYSSLYDIKKDCCIIHLVGHYKPWIYFDGDFVSEWDEYFRKSPFKFYKLKRKSVKLHKFILSHNIIRHPYIFFKYWRSYGFKIAIAKVRKKLFNNPQYYES
jgi:lipopolysaccharide biosynthesis glycosyltransferase